MKKIELRRMIILIKLDADSLFSRVFFRKDDYLQTMVLKRTREHFNKIFRTRYYDLKINDLICFDEKIITEMEKYYTEIEELEWYLSHTEDLPATIEDKINPTLQSIEQHYESMCVGLESILNELNGPPEINLG